MIFTRHPLALMLVLSACGDVVEPPPAPEPGELTVANRSQYVLVELRIHAELDYRSSSNIAAGGIAIDDEQVLVASGMFYVTVFREKYRGGPLIALTTADPIAVGDRERVQLIVFDESFRRRTVP